MCDFVERQGVWGVFVVRACCDFTGKFTVVGERGVSVKVWCSIYDLAGNS